MSIHSDASGFVQRKLKTIAALAICLFHEAARFNANQNQDMKLSLTCPIRRTYTVRVAQNQILFLDVKQSHARE